MQLSEATLFAAPNIQSLNLNFITALWDLKPVFISK